MSKPSKGDMRRKNRKYHAKFTERVALKKRRNIHREWKRAQTKGNDMYARTEPKV
jgi:hypothetical protein